MDPYSDVNLFELSTEDLFVSIYILACQNLKFIQALFGPLRRCADSLKPLFTDAELLTCVIVGELTQPVSQRAWWRQLSSTFQGLFPDLPSWGQYKRRAVAAGHLIELFRRQIVRRTCAAHGHERLVDGKPVELAHISRARGNLNKRFRPNILVDKYAPGGPWRIKPDAGYADIGYCASKKEFIFGMKLHMTCNLERVPMAWTMTPMTGDERQALYELIEQDPLVLCGGWLRVFADKGYIDQQMATELWEVDGHDLQAMPKKNSQEPWSSAVSKMVSGARQGVETAFSEAGRFFGLERFRPASLAGLMSSMAAKITALTLRSLQHLLPLMIQEKI